MPGYVERAARDLDEGASGLKLLPLFVDMEMGDPAWRPIFEVLRKYQRPCIIDLSWWYAQLPYMAPSVYGKYETFTEYAQGLHDLFNDFPDVKVQLAHFGTPRLMDPGGDGRIHYERLAEQIDLVNAHPNTCFDLGAYQHVITADEPYPFQSALKIVEVLVEGVGAQRINWGTDWPYLGQKPYPELIRTIREAPFLKPGEADAILGGNAMRFVAGK